VLKKLQAQPGDAARPSTRNQEAQSGMARA